MILDRFLAALSAAVAGTAILAGAAGASDPVRGVTDTEIVIGTITDLSVLTAVQGVNNADAIRMVFDEANAKGGIHSRKIKHIVEDSQYTVDKSFLNVVKGGRWAPVEQEALAY